MNKFLEDKARWRMFLKELGINQQKAAEMMGMGKDSVARAISKANEDGRDFPRYLINIIEFVDLMQRFPKETASTLLLIDQNEDAFPKGMRKTHRFAKKLQEKTEIHI